MITYVEIRTVVMKRKASVSLDCCWSVKRMVERRVVRLSMRGEEAIFQVGEVVRWRDCDNAYWRGLIVEILSLRGRR